MDNLKTADLIVINYLSKLFFDRSIDSNNEEDSNEETELYLHRLKVRINNPVIKLHHIESFIERIVDMSTASKSQSHFRITMIYKFSIASKSNSSSIRKCSSSWTPNYKSETIITCLFVAISNTR